MVSAVADKIDSDTVSMLSAVHWVESVRILLANGDIYSFKERPYLINPLETRSRLVCVRKGRGLGFSETFIQKSFHGLEHGIYRQGVQYVFPTETAMREFVQSRFNVILRRNPLIRAIVKDTDTTYFKRVGEGNLFLNGGTLTTSIEGMQKESMVFRGKQIDLAVIDELDMFENANDVVQSALTSMMNSPTKAVTAISNPSIPNYGIDKLFQESNQMFWYRQCRSCGELTCPDKEFPDLIDKKGCHCIKCGDLLTYRGKWKPDYPERKDLEGTESKNWEGYHISDLSAPMVKPYSIVEAFKDKSDANQEKVNKFSLGLPFMPKTNALTLAEVYYCCGYQPEYETYTDGSTIMGVDVGSSSGFHVVIGIKTGKEEYQIFKVDKLESFEDAAVLGHRFGVRNCVCDMDPEATYAKKFQKDAGFRVWLNRYNTTNPVDEVVWDYDNRLVRTFRNYIFDISMQVVSDKRVKLPRRSSKIDEFAKQYIVPVKIADIRRPGNFKYFSPSANDHYRNAMNYFLIAAKISGVTRPYGVAKKKLSFVNNDTERYV